MGMKTEQHHPRVWEPIQQNPEWSGCKGIGIDIAPISRIAKLIDRYDSDALNLLFTPGEIDRCQAASDPYQAYALCFATKEAVGKALGTGLSGIGWNEIEANITPNRSIVHLEGAASLQAAKLGVREWLVTWTHWDRYVLVHVLAQ